MRPLSFSRRVANGVCSGLQAQICNVRQAQL